MVLTKKAGISHDEGVVVSAMILCGEMMVEKKRERLWGGHVREVLSIDASGDAPGSPK